MFENIMKKLMVINNIESLERVDDGLKYSRAVYKKTKNPFPDMARIEDMVKRAMKKGVEDEKEIVETVLNQFYEDFFTDAQLEFIYANYDVNLTSLLAG